MKKRLLPIIIALGLLIAGCTAKTVSSPSPESISVYRVLDSEYQSDGALIEAETVALSGNDTPVLQAAAAISQAPQSEKLLCPLPAGIRILDAVADGNSVTVNLNSEYLDVSGFDKTVLDCCITMTMCSIAGIDFVSICVGSETIQEKLSTEDFLLFDNIISSHKAQVKIYFPKAAEQTLSSEYRTISFDNENSAERSILDALFEGPVSDSLQRAFPIGTIVLSVYTQDALCSVSLSGISMEDTSHTADEAKLAVYSIVNSLTTLKGIGSVQILIDGKQVQSLWGFDISKSLTRNNSIIGSAVTG
ncbi:MAG: GerMN domain-containing protein [Oscillospiraceae bacterium]|nr:GerMN domain-containing protein [Oscillospiraceae bacterium]